MGYNNCGHSIHLLRTLMTFFYFSFAPVHISLFPLVSLRKWNSLMTHKGLRNTNIQTLLHICRYIEFCRFFHSQMYAGDPMYILSNHIFPRNAHPCIRLRVRIRGSEAYTRQLVFRNSSLEKSIRGFVIRKISVV